MRGRASAPKYLDDYKLRARKSNDRKKRNGHWIEHPGREDRHGRADRNGGNGSYRSSCLADRCAYNGDPGGHAYLHTVLLVASLMFSAALASSSHNGGLV